MPPSATSLQNLAELYIDKETSPEMKAAIKMVKDQDAALTLLKKRMQRDGVTKVEIRREKMLKRLKFDVSVCRRVDVKNLPDDIVDEYRTESKVWKKQVDVIDLDEVSKIGPDDE
ncbi:hypothetical protein HK097_002212 [Rhizophlyctis rosea]|uniref:Uncharacterized protein n=1 Tax=Rhizophlyctis rosea TaxID=64517 RepID=A0AAD5X778_9FUNG|nr:hypothetical protein HK097_002212 [Rhizophlyctis rosea]